MTNTLDQSTDGPTPLATTSPPPSVGIFWGLRERDGPWELVYAALPLSEAEPYGDCLTYPGAHYDVWEGWRRLRPAGLRKRGLPAMIASHEYEHFPAAASSTRRCRTASFYMQTVAYIGP